MKDERGKYYYPFPHNKNVRMYVQEKESIIHFRLWNADDPELWSQHGWLPYDAIMQAQAMYDKKHNFNPEQAYDLNIAKEVLSE